MGQNKAQRPNDMGRIIQQHFAFGQGFADQTKFIMFEIAQSTMDQLGTGRGGCAGKVVLFTQQDFKAPARRIARDPGTIDATADHDQIIIGCV